jgi:micrococcal nuclease
MYEYKATIKDVYDGDTVTAIVDLGFHNQTTIKVRLHGINTPELEKTTREAGIKSRDRLRELILGKEVVIKTFKDKQEKFGRWLGEIYLPGNLELSVNQILLNEGLAVPFMT